MLSIEYTKKVLGDPTMSDREAKKIRDIFDGFADILFEKWQQEKKYLADKNEYENGKPITKI